MLTSDFNNSQRERLKSLVDIDDNSGCWIFRQSLNKGGYGQVSFNGKVSLVHRVSYAMYKGDITDGLFVRHSNNCISRACCNPDHLTLGTNVDNMQDVRDAGHSKVVTGSGEEHYNSRLTDSDVAEIRRAIREDRKKPVDFVKEFNVGVDVICKAVRGETWGHVPNPITEDELPNLKMRLRKHDIPVIRERVWNGEPASRVARDYGVDVAVITRSSTGVLWENVPGALEKDFFDKQSQIILDRGWRVCLKCNKIKDLTDFTKNKTSLNGFGSRCKPCDNLRRK